MHHRARTCVACLALLPLGACQQGVPARALALTPESLQNRQMQTRRFSSDDEAKVLAACAGVVQDLGFTIDASESRLGLIVGSKDRDATDAGQIAGAVLVAILTGASTPVDKNQKIRVSVVTHVAGGQTAVRVTFQRTIWNTQGQVSRLEFINDPEIYREFFDKLSKSVFLEAQQV